VLLVNLKHLQLPTIHSPVHTPYSFDSTVTAEPLSKSQREIRAVVAYLPTRPVVLILYLFVA
jgi:hypothetical protein